MYTEDDLLPISALQHLVFCERQCALIHVEGLWVENRLTVEGKQLHEKVHAAGGETRAGVRIVRGLPLRSLRLGLSGIADVVEFHAPDRADEPSVAETSTGSPLAFAAERPFPVEYKRGRPKRHDADRVQLCAQALCLEEMLGGEVPAGALFYGRTRRRLDVRFDPDLRQRTERAAARLHELVERRETPAVPRGPKCETCSLLNLCLPGATASRRGASRYLKRALQQLGLETTDQDTVP
ncbi:MAG: CRISPR-associated protein Cas4 [Phycisphaerae bacterium]|nr:CRISPR-associated protein Cas4 [Phycisphaerae bacterium]